MASPSSTALGAESRELAVHLTELPLLAPGGRGQRVDAVAQRVEPVPDRVAAAEAIGDVLQPVDELGHPSGEVDGVGADVVERQDGVEPPLGVVGDGDTGEDAIEAEPPGVVDLVQPERRPVVGVERPAHAGHLDPAADGLEVVLGEAEPTPDGFGGHEVEHLAGLDASVGEVEQRPDDGHQRVGLGERAVGEPDLQAVARVPRAAVRVDTSPTSPRPNAASTSGA